jgi:hypothetical protein
MPLFEKKIYTADNKARTILYGGFQRKTLRTEQPLTHAIRAAEKIFGETAATGTGTW